MEIRGGDFRYNTTHSGVDSSVITNKYRTFNFLALQGQRLAVSCQNQGVDLGYVYVASLIISIVTASTSSATLIRDSEFDKTCNSALRL